MKDVESRLQVSEESAKQAHDLMRYILQERPNLDSSIAECLSEYMKGGICFMSFCSWFFEPRFRKKKMSCRPV